VKITNRLVMSFQKIELKWLSNREKGYHEIEMFDSIVTHSCR